MTWPVLKPRAQLREVCRIYRSPSQTVRRMTEMILANYTPVLSSSALSNVSPSKLPDLPSVISPLLKSFFSQLSLLSSTLKRSTTRVYREAFDKYLREHAVFPTAFDHPDFSVADYIQECMLWILDLHNAKKCPIWCVFCAGSSTTTSNASDWLVLVIEDGR